jgi:hypothetical protein
MIYSSGIFLRKDHKVSISENDTLWEIFSLKRPYFLIDIFNEWSEIKDKKILKYEPIFLAVSL